MHIGRHIIQELVLEFGEPVVERWTESMQGTEFAELKQQMALGRAHDVTNLIVRADEVAVIRKPQDPPGGFAAPSGAIHPEEPFVDGALREAKEATGLDVRIEAYLLYVLVSFAHGDDSAKWSTHVLLSRPVAEALAPSEASDVQSARWMGWDELLREVNPVLRATGLGGWVYRARLHEKAHEVLLQGPRASS